MPANHCPGSVMFLFERLEGLRHSTKVARRILYTGDFRFLLNPNIHYLSCVCIHSFLFRFDHTSGNFVTPELASLHDRQGKPLPLDELYLDTTFCSPLYKTFPTREEAQEEIWRLCKKWVTKGSPAWENFECKLFLKRSRHPFFTISASYNPKFV